MRRSATVSPELFGGSLDTCHANYSPMESVIENIPQDRSRPKTSYESAENINGGQRPQIQYHESTRPTVKPSETSLSISHPVMEHMAAGGFGGYKNLQQGQVSEALETFPRSMQNETADRLFSHISGIENFTRKPLPTEATNSYLLWTRRSKIQAGVQNNKGGCETALAESGNSSMVPIRTENEELEVKATRTETMGMQTLETELSKLALKGLKKEIRTYIQAGKIGAARELIPVLEKNTGNKDISYNFKIEINRKIYSRGLTELRNQNVQAALSNVHELLKGGHHDRYKKLLQVAVAKHLLKQAKYEASKSNYEGIKPLMEFLQRVELQGLDIDKYDRQLKYRFSKALGRSVIVAHGALEWEKADLYLQELYASGNIIYGNSMAHEIAGGNVLASCRDAQLGWIGATFLRLTYGDRAISYMQKAKEVESDTELTGDWDTEWRPFIPEYWKKRSDAVKYMDWSREKLYPYLRAAHWDVAWNSILRSIGSRNRPLLRKNAPPETKDELLRNLQDQIPSMIGVNPSWLVMICHVASRVRRWDIASNISLFDSESIKRLPTQYWYLCLLCSAEIEYFHKRDPSSASIYLNQARTLEGDLRYGTVDGLYLLGRILTREGLFEDAEYYQSLVLENTGYAQERIFGSPGNIIATMQRPSPVAGIIGHNSVPCPFYENLSLTRDQIGQLVSTSVQRFRGDIERSKLEFHGISDLFLEWYDTTKGIGIDVKDPRAYNIQPFPAYISDCTIFDFFAAWGRPELLRIALDSPLSEIISVNRRDSNGNTTLHWTAKSYNIEGLNILLDYIKGNPTELESILTRWESETKVGALENPLHVALDARIEKFDGRPSIEVVGILLAFCPLLAAGKDHMGGTPVHRLTSSARTDLRDLGSVSDIWWNRSRGRWDIVEQGSIWAKRHLEKFKHYRDCYALIFKGRSYEECVQLRDAEDNEGTKAVDKAVYGELLSVTGGGIQIFGGPSEFHSSMNAHFDDIEKENAN
ncbi:hypothetical protein TWF730_002326 [Orbilia blumenaviensis]|uniref:Uncharacterized protein n=1 Tax=Orbilia blumenaviensis TaxID=1796055 RepID=A0AAV9U9S5_9PEZI